MLISQWKEMFHLIGSAFQKNGIKYEVCLSKSDFSTKGPLQRFKHDPSIRVLLLLLSHGSHGLTLIEASHVFLLEPIMNVQQEAQAVNRVHRIGQTRSTYVHKYVVNDTVEKRIHDMTESIFEETVGGAQGLVSNITTEKGDVKSPTTSKKFKNKGRMGMEGGVSSDAINLTLTQVRSLLNFSSNSSSFGSGSGSGSTPSSSSLLSSSSSNPLMRSL